MTSTPSVRGNQSEKQAPLAPGRMAWVDDWKSRDGDMVELYADRKAGDGYVIVFGPYGAEHAADIDQATGDEPLLTWIGQYAQRSETWREDLAVAIRKALAEWMRS